MAEAESLEPSEEEMLEAVAEASPGRERVSPRSCWSACKSNGRLDSLKDDLSQRKALDLVAESAKPVPATSSQIPDHGRSRSWSNDPGRTTSSPLLVFGRVVRHGPSAI